MPLWRTVTCAAVLSGRRANAEHEHCCLPALVVGGADGKTRGERRVARLSRVPI